MALWPVEWIEIGRGSQVESREQMNKSMLAVLSDAERQLVVADRAG